MDTMTLLFDDLDSPEQLAKISPRAWIWWLMESSGEIPTLRRIMAATGKSKSTAKRLRDWLLEASEKDAAAPLTAPLAAPPAAPLDGAKPLENNHLEITNSESRHPLRHPQRHPSRHPQSPQGPQVTENKRFVSPPRAGAREAKLKLSSRDLKNFKNNPVESSAQLSSAREYDADYRQYVQHIWEYWRDWTQQQRDWTRPEYELLEQWYSSGVSGAVVEMAIDTLRRRNFIPDLILYCRPMVLEIHQRFAALTETAPDGLDFEISSALETLKELELGERSEGWCDRIRAAGSEDEVAKLLELAVDEAESVIAFPRREAAS